jgi:hypothetical protein
VLSVALLWCAPCRGTLPRVAMADDNVVRWAHPAGLVTEETIAEIRSKIATQDWARRMYSSRKDGLDRWLTVPAEELRRVFPRRRGNVYHNFSCPQDRCRLRFDPLEPDAFECPLCGTTFAPETDAGVYRPDERYAGTMYDGWVCLFHLDASQSAADLGLISRIELAADGAKYGARGVEILMLYADTLETLATKTDADPQMTVLLTYHREGDSAVLYQLARAYELLRDRMAPERRDGFERSVLLRMLDDLMLEPIYRYNHNNLYQWHRDASCGRATAILDADERGNVQPGGVAGQRHATGPARTRSRRVVRPMGRRSSHVPPDDHGCRGNGRLRAGDLPGGQRGHHAGESAVPDVVCPPNEWRAVSDGGRRLDRRAELAERRARGG